MPRDPIVVGVEPTGSPGAAKTSNTVSEQQLWEQVCHMQGDMRALLVQSKLMTDISKSMLAEQQQMRTQTERLIEKVTDAIEHMSSVASQTSELARKTSDFIDKNDDVMDNISDAIESLEGAIKANDQNVDSIIDEMFTMMDENQINMDELSSSIDMITRSSLIVAYAITAGSDSMVATAEEKAVAKIVADQPINDAMRAATREDKRMDREKRLAAMRQKRVESRKT